jgi:hypothetical protein
MLRVNLECERNVCDDRLAERLGLYTRLGKKSGESDDKSKTILMN